MDKKKQSNPQRVPISDKGSQKCSIFRKKDEDMFLLDNMKKKATEQTGVLIPFSNLHF